VCRNVLADPREPKFRALKLSNESIQRRLIQRPGGLDFVLAAGWIRQQRLNVLELVSSLPLAPLEPHVKAGGAPAGSSDEAAKAQADVQLIRLQQALDWLESTTVTFTAYHLQAGRAPSDPVAECTLQLRLPTSKVTAGFMRNDTLEAVYRYAETYFVKERRGQLSLRLPDSSAVALEARKNSAGSGSIPPAPATHGDTAAGRTLEALDLCPRAALLVTVADDAQRADLFSSTHQTGVEKHHVAKLVHSGRGEAEKKKKVQEKAEKELQRTQALAAFRDDRQDR